MSAWALTSMGLMGVEGNGWRYSGCRRCPARAASIFRTLMGRRLAWRDGCAGDTELWTDCWLPVAAPSSPGEPLCHAGFVLFLRKDTVGDAIMTQFSHKWSGNACVWRHKQAKPAAKDVRRLEARVGV